MQFRNHRRAGDIVELAARYAHEGADELVFYDITASPENRTVDRVWVDRVARELDIPFCVAGGVRSVADAERILASGADKISINSPALEQPDLIDALAARFGSQCVVLGVDSRQVDGHWQVFSHTGSEATTRGAGRDTLQWLDEAEQRGAGEIVLNCMQQDGVKGGYDIEHVGAAAEQSSLPVVASGGAGAITHFQTLFEETAASAALAATVFHDKIIAIPELKTTLRNAGIEIRP